MMHQHPCDEIRERLEAYHDGELAIDEQVAIQGHLNECVGCSLAVAELAELGSSLRHIAAEMPDRGSYQSPNVLSSVLERMGVEERLSFGTQIRSLFQDMHLVWAGLGATVATIVCLVGSMSVLHAASTERPDSLAGVISFLANPGSNANPMPLDVEMLVPRARPDRSVRDVAGGRCSGPRRRRHSRRPREQPRGPGHAVQDGDAREARGGVGDAQRSLTGTVRARGGPRWWSDCGEHGLALDQHDRQGAQRRHPVAGEAEVEGAARRAGDRAGSGCARHNHAGSDPSRPFVRIPAPNAAG